jgi:hypothetical protein
MFRPPPRQIASNQACGQLWKSREQLFSYLPGILGFSPQSTALIVIDNFSTPHLKRAAL